MTFEEFCKEMNDLFPQCQIQTENNREIIVFTNKMVKYTDHSDINEVIDLVDEPCKCSDCQRTEREKMEEEDYINPPECYDDSPAPTKYLVARLEDRVSLLEHTLDALLTQKKTDLGLNLVAARQTFYRNDPN